MPGGEWFVWRVRIDRTASHEPLATNHYAPPARIATCVFGVSPDLYIADRDEGVFVPQTLRFGGLWLGVAVYCRSGQDAGVELESSRDRQRWHLQEFNLTCQALPAVRT